MDAGHLAAFTAVSALVIVTPGQDTLLTVKNTLAGGRRAGVLTAAGVSAGQAVWTVFASLGLTALLVASETAFLALRLAGAAYLVFLGLQALAAAFRHRTPLERDGARTSPGSALRQGLLSNLANPKMAVFFSSLLPQFAGAGSGSTSFAAMLVLGLAFCSMTLVWLAGYAALVSRARDVFQRSRVRRSLEAAMGAVLVGLGLRVAAETR
jgi:threonine/homoserine/homoserine lactone efflux protein